MPSWLQEQRLWGREGEKEMLETQLLCDGLSEVSAVKTESSTPFPFTLMSQSFMRLSECPVATMSLELDLAKQVTTRLPLRVSRGF